MKPFVILNPAAGRGRAARYRETLVGALKETFPRFEIVETGKVGDAERLTRSFLKEGVEWIVAAGGDGTVHEVVNGFFEEGRPVRSQSRLGIVPAGTGSDFARHLGRGRSHDIATWVRRLKSGKEICSDVGWVEWEGGHRAFINITDVGLGGEAALRVKRGVPYIPKGLVYLASGLISLVTFHAPEVAVLLPSGEVIRERILMLVIANGQYFGVGMNIAPQAKIDDGLFDVILIRDRSLPGIVSGIAKIYRGRISDLPGVTYRRVQRLEVSGSSPAPLDIDGEPLGRLPARFAVIPAAIKLIVP